METSIQAPKLTCGGVFLQSLCWRQRQAALWGSGQPSLLGEHEAERLCLKKHSREHLKNGTKVDPGPVQTRVHAYVHTKNEIIENKNLWGLEVSLTGRTHA